MHYSKKKKHQGVTQSHRRDCSESAVSLLSQPLFSTRVRTGITRPNQYFTKGIHGVRTKAGSFKGVTSDMAHGQTFALNKCSCGDQQQQQMGACY